MDSAITPRHERIPCPYCGALFGNNKHPHHVRTCIDSPTVREAVAAALQGTTPGVGITAEEYRDKSPGLGIPSRSTIIRRYGNWDAVLASFGLKPPHRNAPRVFVPDLVRRRMTSAEREAAAIQDVDAMSANARAVLASEYDAAHTLHGCAVRDLPGVTVGGRPCVAVMLR